MLFRRPSTLTALAALATATALGGCMVHTREPEVRGSIKDPVATSPMPVARPVAMRVAAPRPTPRPTVERARVADVAPAVKVSVPPPAPTKSLIATPAPVPQKSAAIMPPVVLPPSVSVPAAAPAAAPAIAAAPERTGRIEAVAPDKLPAKPVDNRAAEKAPDPPVASAPSPARTPVVLQPAPTPAPATTPPAARPTIDARRAEPTPMPAPVKSAAVAPPAAPPVVAAPPPVAPTVPVASAPAVAPSAAAAPVVAIPAPSPVVTAPAATAPAVTAPVEKPSNGPRIAALSETQRVKATLARAQDYLRANRISDARTLLEDAARDGHPEVLFALAETWDPLVLREANPRLARAGDVPRAIAAYEAARARGAPGADPRIDALKALPR